MIQRVSYSPLIASLLIVGGVVACGEPADSGDTEAGLGSAAPGATSSNVPGVNGATNPVTPGVTGSGDPTGTGTTTPGDPATGNMPVTGAPGTGSSPATGGASPNEPVAGAPGVMPPGSGEATTTPDDNTPTPGGGDPSAPAGGMMMPGSGEPATPGGETMMPGDTPTPGVDPSMPVTDPAVPVGNGSCTFNVSHELSSEIGTVGIVTWSTDMAVDSATIEFGLAGAEASLSAPVDLTAPEYRTLLLGMKGNSDYEFRIVANGGGQTCTSETFALTTEPVPNPIPVISRQVMNEMAVTRGFYVTSSGIGNIGFGGGGGGGGSYMFIFDQDGDVVWWASAPGNCSSAKMDWEGNNMWMTTLNYPQSGGEMRRVSMDGLDAENNVQGLNNNHHDFTVAPGGVVTSISYAGGCDSIIERSPDGSIKTVVEDVSTLYQPGGGLTGGTECHVNAITYQPDADTYVISDRNPSIYVRFARDGSLMWQFGGSNPKGTHFAGSWNVNHGHHLLANGNLLFFNNENGNQSPVKEYSLDEASGQASLVWEYTGGGGSATLGDAQRLPNGNTIVTYSNSGTIVEVDPGKNVIQRFTTDSLGYTTFRETLYGPPPR